MIQLIFIILVVSALLGGLLSKCNSQQTSLKFSIFNFFGVKTKEQKQQELVDTLLKSYIKDQEVVIEGSQEEIATISQMLEENLRENTDMDLLRLKSLMKEFEDLNVLMIENGQALLDLNQIQRKKNKKAVEASIEAGLQSKSIQKELLEKQKAALEHQQRLANELRNIQNNQSIKDRPELALKLNAMASKTLVNLENLKQGQEQMRRSSNDMKDKLDDLRNKNRDAMNENRIRMEDRTRQMNERMRDQLERMRDKR